MRSADDIFYISAIITLALIAFVWFARPEKRGGAVGAADAH
jgi:hypothetical protein